MASVVLFHKCGSMKPSFDGLTTEMEFGGPLETDFYTYYGPEPTRIQPYSSIVALIGGSGVKHLLWKRNKFETVSTSNHCYIVTNNNSTEFMFYSGCTLKTISAHENMSIVLGTIPTTSIITCVARKIRDSYM